MRTTFSEICGNVAHLETFNGLLKQDEICLNGGWNLRESIAVGYLLPLTFTKQDLEVHLVNMAFYSNGGMEDWVVFSDDVGAVQTFLSDHGVETTIYAEMSVHQTL